MRLPLSHRVQYVIQPQDSSLDINHLSYSIPLQISIIQIPNGYHRQVVYLKGFFHKFYLDMMYKPQCQFLVSMFTSIHSVCHVKEFVMLNGLRDTLPKKYYFHKSSWCQYFLTCFAMSLFLIYEIIKLAVNLRKLS